VNQEPSLAARESEPWGVWVNELAMDEWCGLSDVKKQEAGLTKACTRKVEEYLRNELQKDIRALHTKSDNKLCEFKCAKTFLDFLFRARRMPRSKSWTGCPNHGKCLCDSLGGRWRRLINAVRMDPARLLVKDLPVTDTSVRVVFGESVRRPRIARIGDGATLREQGQ
jgi:hypothetical protein